ncbi:hypothetical protein RRG08_012495 [Elysia crispata]|uniref:LicD/FKTN/FKRP nucleotidyltransferase domain-containing protein n=1 Tax=Elysia crispata TaxID=231223 RepID=A0AAE1E3A6_9GAST|nr:hypothetical protein RRG08_012495 [Elysia crispata]
MEDPFYAMSFENLNQTRLMLTSLETIGRNKLPNVIFRNHRAILKTKEITLQTWAFHPIITVEEKEILLLVFQKFVRACENLKVTFFLYGGALLGSFRHHDMIPWDDDIDVFVPAEKKNLLQRALVPLNLSGFSLYHPLDKPWKFYWSKPKTLLHKPFRWPYIDIFFYEDNGTHIFDQQREYRFFAYRKIDVFPLTVRPFAGAFLPAPCNTDAVLRKNYSPNLCSSPRFSHKTETMPHKTQHLTIPCKRLHNVYPFVFRRWQESGNSVTEEVKIGGATFHSVQLNVHCDQRHRV